MGYNTFSEFLQRLGEMVSAADLVAPPTSPAPAKAAPVKAKAAPAKAADKSTGS